MGVRWFRKANKVRIIGGVNLLYSWELSANALTLETKQPAKKEPALPLGYKHEIARGRFYESTRGRLSKCTPKCERRIGRSLEFRKPLAFR